MSRAAGVCEVDRLTARLAYPNRSDRNPAVRSIQNTTVKVSRMLTVDTAAAVGSRLRPRSTTGMASIGTRRTSIGLARKGMLTFTVGFWIDRTAGLRSLRFG